MSNVRDERLLAGPAHPLCIAATALLLLNDHVLKAAYGNAWTGKLSDVCWLIVASVVLGAVLHTIGLKSRLARAGSLVCVAAFFTALQLWSPLGDTIAGWLGSVHVADPTDLLVLPVMALVPVCWRTARKPLPVLLGISMFAVVGSAWTPCPDCHDPSKRYPCNEEAAWDPNVPLFLHFGGRDVGDQDERGLEIRTPALRSNIRVYGPDGNEVDTFVAKIGTTDVAICPSGGLQPSTRYTWTVGPFKTDSNNSLAPPTLGDGAEGTWSFVTDETSDNASIDTQRACAGVHFNVYDALHCDTEPDTGRWDDTGDTGQ